MDPLRVGRTAQGLQHGNTLVMRTLKLYFQRCPGTAGSEAERGIKDVPYRLLLNGAVAATGKTASDGSVTVRLPASASAILEIFGTEYQIIVRNSIEAPDQFAGVVQRLEILGYEPGPTDRKENLQTDYALLCLQADSGSLKISGDWTDSSTQSHLKSLVGE